VTSRQGSPCPRRRTSGSQRHCCTKRTGSKTIERVFADLKEKHGMRVTMLRGIEKVHMQVLLTCTCFNMKKLANWIWKKGKGGPGKGKNLEVLLEFFSKVVLAIIKPHLSFIEKWGFVNNLKRLFRAAFVCYFYYYFLPSARVLRSSFIPGPIVEAITAFFIKLPFTPAGLRARICS